MKTTSTGRHAVVGPVDPEPGWWYAYVVGIAYVVSSVVYLSLRLLP